MIAVLREMEGKGPFCSLVVSVTVVKDVLARHPTSQAEAVRQSAPWHAALLRFQPPRQRTQHPATLQPNPTQVLLLFAVNVELVAASEAYAAAAAAAPPDAPAALPPLASLALEALTAPLGKCAGRPLDTCPALRPCVCAICAAPPLLCALPAARGSLTLRRRRLTATAGAGSCFPWPRECWAGWASSAACCTRGWGVGAATRWPSPSRCAPAPRRDSPPRQHLLRLPTTAQALSARETLLPEPPPAPRHRRRCIGARAPRRGSRCWCAWWRARWRATGGASAASGRGRSCTACWAACRRGRENGTLKGGGGAPPRAAGGLSTTKIIMPRGHGPLLRPADCAALSALRPAPPPPSAP